MSAIQQNPTWLQSATVGAAPAFWQGVDLPDGDRGPWLDVPIGSIYVYKPDEVSQARYYVKRGVIGIDADWGALGGYGVFHGRFTYAQMTDGGSTIGTIVIPGTIPVGAVATRTYIRDLTGFTGNVSATIQIGDGSDVDRYTTGTPSVFTTATILDPGAVSGTAIHATAVSAVTVTITASSDYTAVVAGALAFDIYYLL